MSFRRLTIEQLLKELDKYTFGEHHVHHTWKPNHDSFNGSNHQALQRGMKNYHVNTKGWSDIAQHVTLFPDGTFLTGRSFNRAPASSKGHNRKNGKIPFMMEMIGDFNYYKDKFEGKQKENALKIARYFLNKNIPVKFHRQMDRTQSCPGGAIHYNKYIAEAKGQSISPSKPSKPSRKPVSTLLRRGSRGSTVKRLQNDLISAGYSVGRFGADGIFGNSTESAVRKLQKDYRIAVDGIVGKDTRLALEKAISKKNAFKKNMWDYYIQGNAVKKLQSELNRQFNARIAVDGYYGKDTDNATVNVRQGARGNLTRIVQERLNAKGYNLVEDGIFGSGTNRRVKQFQRNNGLAVDGIVGENTWKALYRK